MSQNEPAPDPVPIDEDAQLYPYCYLCHFPALQDGFYHLFAEPDTTWSRAKILGDILDVELTPELCHSQIICVNCNTQCLEYHSLVQRMEAIREKLMSTYNQTVMKLTGLTEKDLKEGLVAVDEGESLENDLHTFNKEFLSMEDMFGDMEELNPDEIHLNPTSEQLNDTLPQLGIVWETEAAAEGMSSSSLIHSAELPPATSQATSVHIKEEQFINAPEEHALQLQPLDSELMVESSPSMLMAKLEPTDSQLLPIDTDTQPVDPELCEEETLHRFMLESNETIVEVAGEDGTSIYCVYKDVTETASDTEEQAGTVARTLERDNGASLLEYDDVIVDSTSQISTSESYEMLDASSSVSMVMVKSDATRSRSPSASQEGETLQPRFVKVGSDYYCTLCSTDDPVKESSPAAIAQHLTEEHGKPTYACERCDFIFFQQQSYIDHLAEHTTKPHSCETAINRTDEQQQKAQPGGANSKIWNCDICDKKYTSKAFYEVHMNKHAGLRPYKCHLCVKDFSSKYALAVHQKTHSERPRTFVCNECGNSFYSRHNLLQHERTHRAVREYECRVCRKKFFTQHNLNVHMVIHSADKAFACRECGKKFARKPELLDHERIHTGEKPFACDMCDASFAQRSNLHSHRRMTHLNDKRFKCDLCNAAFKRRRLLTYHVRAMHTGERPYKCELCQATFVYPEHFQKHKRIHTGIKPYACEVCHRTFTSQDNRNAHRYVHSDKKPFECVTCGAGFMRKSHLYTHMQEAGHLSDTIVVNQPRISANRTLEFETDTYVTDGTGESEQGPEIEGSDEENAQIAYVCEEDAGAVVAD